MRSIIIITIIFILLETFVICKSAKAAVSFQQAKGVFAKVCNTSGYHLILKYSDDTNSNAWCDSYGTIYINQGMLNDLENESQLAMVLGHEVSHYVHKDYRKEKKNQEIDADKLGYYYCKKSGYKKCLGFFTNMLRKYGEEGDDGIHPSWTTRLQGVINNG